MANLSDFLNKAQGPRAAVKNGPGSNGYWQRKGYLSPGSYTFRVPRTGRYKLTALGAGSGGKGRATSGAVNSGSGGSLAIGEYDLVRGDLVLVTIGAPGLGAPGDAAPGDGGTTTISCAARGVLLTAPGGRTSSANTRATGGNIANNIGGSTPISPSTGAIPGGASSATPNGDGFASAANAPGGSGWGGSASGLYGTSSNTLSDTFMDEMNGKPSNNATNTPFWDLDDITGASGMNAGNGAGGDCNNTGNATSRGGTGGFGGGGGAGTSGSGTGQNGGSGGHGGGGGGARGSGTANVGGDGGPGAALIHWDEVI